MHDFRAFKDHRDRRDQVNRDRREARDSADLDQEDLRDHLGQSDQELLDNPDVLEIRDQRHEDELDQRESTDLRATLLTLHAQREPIFRPTSTPSTVRQHRISHALSATTSCGTGTASYTLKIKDAYKCKISATPAPA